MVTSYPVVLCFRVHFKRLRKKQKERRKKEPTKPPPNSDNLQDLNKTKLEQLPIANTQQMQPYAVFHSVLCYSKQAGFGSVKVNAIIFSPQTTHLNVTSNLGGQKFLCLNPSLSLAKF